mgnify:CR=1 FL=1
MLYKLSVYNHLGEKIIDNLINQYLESGKHTIIVSSENLDSGNYLYILETPNGNVTGMMNVINEDLLKRQNLQKSVGKVILKRV